MKTLHRPDLFGWSQFDPARNIDFNSVAWIRPEGNVVIDPLALSEHDLRHLTELGGVAWIVVTNGDHVRATEDLVQRFGARVAGPRGEEGRLPVRCDRWLGEGDELVPGLIALELKGSKTTGELVLVLDRTTLITGDLIRAHRAGSLMLLPDPKLSNRGEAVASVRRLLSLEVEAVLVGDGWSIFRDGHEQLRALAANL